MSVCKLYDVLVVGGGPAGLGATLALARLHRSVVMFDSGVYRNAASDAMHTVVGVDGMKPSDWLERGRSQLAKSGEYGQWIDIVPRKVVEVQRVASSAGQTRFSLRDEQGDDWHSRKVILANGVTDELPDIQGFQELWGKSVAHCVYCHGQELCQGPNPRLGVLMTADPAANGMLMHSLSNFHKLISGDRITIFVNGQFQPDANGNPPIESGISPESLTLLKARKIGVEFTPITSFKPTSHGHTISLKSGVSIDLSGTLYFPVIKANDMFGLATPPKTVMDSPCDITPGVFIAGNAKVQFSGVNAAEGDGMLAVATGAAVELGKEDAAADIAAAATVA